jgi:predicted  nucleic acid-binding Zn-ribbon protein
MKPRSSSGIHVQFMTTRVCKDCGNYYRIGSFSKDPGCPKCSSRNTESAHKDFRKKPKKEQDRIMQIILELQRKDMIARANKDNMAS